MQRNPWMRPALQTSEAVLLPALPKRKRVEPRFSDRYTLKKAEEDPFRPFPTEMDAHLTTALSTYVRSRGSMAGKSVLRAAGVSASPFSQHARPRYAAVRKRTLPVPLWPRGR